MTTTLNATTSSGLVVTPDNSGNVLLQYNGVAAPAFSAYGASAQSIAGGSYVKVVLDTKEFDTASCFNTSTYRFTPNVAGYYQFNWMCNMGSYSNRYTSYLYKNGGIFKSGVNVVGNGVNNAGSGGAALVYANGTTDYFELYLQGNNSSNLTGGAADTFLQGCLLRGA